MRSHHWLRKRLGAEQATSHYPNHWWPRSAKLICNTKRWVKISVYHISVALCKSAVSHLDTWPSGQAMGCLFSTVDKKRCDILKVCCIMYLWSHPCCYECFLTMEQKADHPKYSDELKSLSPGRCIKVFQNLIVKYKFSQHIFALTGIKPLFESLLIII